jgi:hypothetical protein
LIQKAETILLEENNEQPMGHSIRCNWCEFRFYDPESFELMGSGIYIHNIFPAIEKPVQYFAKYVDAGKSQT